MKTPFKIMKEMEQVIGRIDEKQYRNFVELLLKDSRFFVFGEGRSGLIGKAIAMRLMHCGKEVYVVGETIAPSIGEEDVLLAISGSAGSIQLTGICRQASKHGAHITLITTNEAKLQEDWCSSGMVIPAATKKRAVGEPSTIQPLGSQFDQAVHLVLDAAIVDGPYANHSHESIKKQHTNLE
ncbi:6-phospho-3-hexuloisomerase [Planococcus halotolerans]|uniref:6-phospho-3-hexuloisomerase n=1 Tax=Planococcus halotolerans TaxID=2233542 RepID=UPI001092BA64|nr:6-phospho-3-hexuloisomerase [Planococcus halotolerans]QHJ70096.1 SIS domain-containing protein [Planococcus halotolerans]